MKDAFDLTYLNTLNEQYDGIKEKMLNEFLVKIPAIQKNIMHYFEANQLKMLSDELHILKQSIAYVGFSDFQKELENIYYSLDDGKPEYCSQEQLQEISEKCDLIFDLIQNVINEKSLA